MSVLVITLMVLMSLWVGIRATVLVHDRHLIGVDNALVKAEADAVRRKKGITLKAAMRAGRMFDTVGILAGVREAVPDDGALLLDSVDLNISDGRFVVGGTAETRKEIGVFVRNLEQHDLLFNVKESGATGKGRDDRYRFQIAGQIGESDDS